MRITVLSSPVVAAGIAATRVATSCVFTTSIVRVRGIHNS
jgi:hypothetical protein